MIKHCDRKIREKKVRSNMGEITRENTTEKRKWESLRTTVTKLKGPILYMWYYSMVSKYKVEIKTWKML